MTAQAYQLNNKDLHTPFNTLTLKKIKSVMLRGISEQAVAASLATAGADRMTPCPQDLTIKDIYVISNLVCAAGESMTYNVLVNGVSILSGVFTLDSTKAAKTQHSLKSLITGSLVLSAGDKVAVTRVYTAGGGPTPMGSNALYIEIELAAERQGG